MKLTIQNPMTCNRCGAEHIPIQGDLGFQFCCTMPNPHRTSGICGGAVSRQHEPSPITSTSTVIFLKVE